MDHGDGPIGELQERLLRHPPERYPVQHATTQYHLGVALAQLGRLSEAESALRTAADLFRELLPVEHAKATNSLGAVLRMHGSLEEAAQAFHRAAVGFGEANLPLERGAALYNLGLVRRELGDQDAATAAFRDARDLLDADRVPAQAAAAARELGATRLMAGDLRTAATALEEAVPLAERGGDQAGLGAAYNALGLAMLGLDRPDDAAEAFRRSAGAHPRGIRPVDFSMAKANLALAYERGGDDHRARLAALQALATPQAPDPVRSQASAILERMGAVPGTVLAVLDDEAPDRWPAVVRDEVVRWVDADPAERIGEAGAWIDGQLARPDRGTELAEALLGALLELPPDAMEAIISSVIVALSERDEEERQRFRSETDMAMARFHVPQLMRLKDTFARIAAEAGHPAVWP